MEGLLFLVFIIAAIGFAIGYARCLKQTGSRSLAVFIGLLCGAGSVVLVAALAFGACLCAVNRHG